MVLEPNRRAQYSVNPTMLPLVPIPPGAAQCLAGPAGIPALALLTDKVTLAQAGTVLQWPFLPESVLTVEAARTQLANGALTWLAKRPRTGL